MPAKDSAMPLLAYGGSGVCLAAVEDNCLIGYSITSSARANSAPTVEGLGRHLLKEIIINGSIAAMLAWAVADRLGVVAINMIVQC
jgi:hypothetical protein